MNPCYNSLAMVSCFANDNDAFVPELWANEGLAILEENMVAAKLVHRDFEPVVAKFGDVVNTRRPGNFKIRRKVDGTTLTQQDARSTNVQVPLDQWFYNSFTIKDGEGSKSFQELVTVYLLPAMQTIARAVDRSVLGRIHQFLGATAARRVGRLGAMDATNSQDFALEARQILNENKAFPDNRNLILSPSSETAFLKTSQFVSAEKRGDGGSALESAMLGRILGFNTYMDQNVNNATLLAADTDVTYLVNGAHAAGLSTIVSGTGSNPVVVGQYVNFAGNDQPNHLIAGTDVSGACTSMVLNEAIKYALLTGAQITIYKAAAVNDPGALYVAGYSETISIDGYTTAKAPQIGQLIAFGTSTSRRTYTVIESTDNGSTCDIILDRPLEVSLTNDQAAFPGPAGSFNWAMHREALALVTRPLALPNQAAGVMAHAGVYNDIAMRVLAQYDINAGGTVVNLDILAGVAQLDANLAVALLG